MSDPNAVLALVTAPTLASDRVGPGFEFADPTAPHLRVDDLGVTRGDGVFESLGVVGGHIQAMEPHLDRFALSAGMLDLPELALDVWREAITAATAAHEPEPELLVKVIVTRGPEGSGVCSGWVLVTKGADFTRQRTEGVDVLVLERGYPADVTTIAPWLLQGAKTLSYALNMATLRHVKARGADDALFVTSDGVVLEGPNSTLVAQFGDELVTPPTELGVLLGTCQGRMFAFGAERGLRTTTRSLSVSELAVADALWLCSSGRLAAPIRSLDGVPRTFDAAFQSALTDFLLTADL